MPKIINLRTNEVVAQNVLLAESIPRRMKGLMGTPALNRNEAMFIADCNWIHTGFMRFTMDAVFVNAEMEVVKIVTNIKPWRICFPVFKAISVIEFESGKWDQTSLRVGDKVNVGTART